MRDLLLRTNLVTKDRLSFFTNQWVEHSASLTMGKLTDLKLVAKEGGVMGTIHVHRAVILPLCTFLKELEKDVAREDPVVCLPDIPFELLNALVRLIYKGFAPVSEVVNVSTLLHLMAMLGLNMPADRLIITREKVEDEVEIVGFKNLDGLEIFRGVKKDSLPSHTSLNNSRPLEITPCSRPSISKGMKKRKIQEKPRVRQLLNRSAKRVKASFQTARDANRSSAEIVTENASDEVLENTGVFAKLPTEVKLECVDDEVTEFTQLKQNETNGKSLSKKRKWSRRKETLDLHIFGCDLCEFKCRFRKDLQEHYARKHTNDTISCRYCGFNSSSYTALCAHNRKKHSKSDASGITGFDEGVNLNTVGKFDKTVHLVATNEAETDTNKTCGLYERLNELELTPKKIIDEIVVENRYNCASSMDVMTREDVAQAIEAVVHDSVNEQVVEYSHPSSGILAKGSKESMKTTKGLYNENINENISNEENFETGFGNQVSQVDVDAINELGTVGSFSEYDLRNENIAVKKLEKYTTIDSNGNTVDVDQKLIVPKQSGELIGFKCGSLGYSKIVKTQHTEASYSLERLKRHFTQVHTDAEENKFTYTNVMKESPSQRVDDSLKKSKKVKDAQKQTNSNSKRNDDPLKILKEVKAAHRHSKEIAKMQFEIETDEMCIENRKTQAKQCKILSSQVSEEDTVKSLKE